MSTIRHFFMSDLLTGQKIYLSVKLRGFKEFLILVWFGVGHVKKTESSFHLKSLKLSLGVGVMFNGNRE